MNELTLLDPLLRRPLITERDIDAAHEVELPAGLRVVSADSHLEIGDDVFIEKFPDHLKPKAPRVWFDKYWHIGFKGETEALKLGERGTNALTRSNLANVQDVARSFERDKIPALPA